MGLWKIPGFFLGSVSTDIFFRVENIPVQPYAWGLITVKLDFCSILVYFITMQQLAIHQGAMKHI